MPMSIEVLFRVAEAGDRRTLVKFRASVMKSSFLFRVPVSWVWVFFNLQFNHGC